MPLEVPMPSLSAQTFSTGRVLMLLAASGCSTDFMLHDDKVIYLGDTGDAGEDVRDFDTGEVEEEEEDTGETPTGEGNTGDDDDDDLPEEDDAPDDTPEEDPAPEDDCDETSDLIYVLDKDAETLSLFDPSSNALTALGALNCDSWSTPASMGVTRDGIAYVRYSDNEVFAVALDTLQCSSTGYSDSGGFGSFGMGFATESAETWRDSLFVANSRQLGRIDPSTWQLTLLGSLPSQGELTGTGAGELFAVLPLESPLKVVELSQSTGSVIDTIQVGTTLDISNLDTFAFAAWDGDFYLFTRMYGMGSSTAVHRIDRSGRITEVVSELGINVVGAGVSTCAPS